jgi:hypothetical protein
MHPHHGGHEHGMGTHNMAIVGDRRVYLSHLPMFMPPDNASTRSSDKLVPAGCGREKACFA